MCVYVSRCLPPEVPHTSVLVLCHCCRFGGGDDVDDPAAEPVDALTMGRMMALVAQQGGDLDVALEQVRPLVPLSEWEEH